MYVIQLDFFSKIPTFCKVEQVLGNILMSKLPDLFRVLWTTNCAITSNNPFVHLNVTLYPISFHANKTYLDKHNMYSSGVSKCSEDWLHLKEKTICQSVK